RVRVERPLAMAVTPPPPSSRPAAPPPAPAAAPAVALRSRLPARPPAEAPAARAEVAADEGPQPGEGAEPGWRGDPSDEVISRAYPVRARAQDIHGLSTIACRVSPAGSLDDCTVASEQPRGFGFGRAALELAPYFRMDPADASGRPVAGRRVRVPVR